MALRNGLLIHGPTSWAVAARAADGAIEVASGPKPRLARGRLASTPLVRGPLRLAEAMAIVPLARLRLGSARLPFEDPAVIATAARQRRRLEPAAPRLRPRRPSAASWRSPRSGRCRRSPPCATRRSPRTTRSSTRRSAATSRDDDPAEVPKEHERCGSNLVGPMLAFSIAGQVVDRAPGRRRRAGRPRGRGAGRRRRRRGAVRVRGAQPRLGGRPGRSTGPATRSSASSRPASRPRSSSRSAWRRCKRSYGPSRKLPIPCRRGREPLRTCD